MIKTLVELYDKEPVENVLSACIFEPEILVFVCDNKDNSLRKETAVYRLLKNKSIKTTPRFYYIDTTNFALIYKTLKAIAKDYPGCVFDFTGGKDLVLLAAGIFCKENQIDGYYIDIATNRFCKVFGCDELAKYYFMPKFSVADIFSLAGATLLGYGHFPLSLIDAEFEKDIMSIWQIMMQNPQAWGGLVGYLQACSRFSSDDSLLVNAKQKFVVNEQTTAVCDMQILKKLEEFNIIKKLQLNGKYIEFRYKNILLKRSLSNHGIWLELYTYLCAKQSALFDDVRTSVLVDWDNVTNRQDTTKNEVDVLLVHGITPVFISCKMGQPTALALSEIRIISEKFGGAFTKTVLMTASNLKKDNKTLWQRAKDLDITVLDKSDLEKNDLAQILLKIAKE